MSDYPSNKSHLSVFQSEVEFTKTHASKALQYFIKHSTSNVMPFNEIYQDLVIVDNALDRITNYLAEYKQKALPKKIRDAVHG